MYARLIERFLLQEYTYVCSDSTRTGPGQYAQTATAPDHFAALFLLR